MPGFRPARSSSPAKSIPRPQQRLQFSTNPEDTSRSSVFLAVPELVGLSNEDVELIDAIIERAGPTANTFLPVWKAYNDVMLERGLDPLGVVYYGKLLQLGTLKGDSWQKKWDAIKAQNGYGAARQDSYTVPKSLTVPKQQPLRSGIVVKSRPGPSTIQDDDLFSSGLHDSQVSDTEDGSSPDGTHPYSASSAVFPSRGGPGFSDLTTNSLGLELDKDIRRPFSVVSTQPPSRRATSTISYDTSEHITSTPPSHHAVTQGFPVKSRSSILPKTLLTKSERLPLTPPSVVSTPINRRDSAINEEDAWKKVAMMNDEREADRFRKDRLVERCFDVWRQGCQWIITTNEQIDQARDNVLLRKLFQRWAQRTLSRRNMYEQVDAFAKRRCQRTFFSVWKRRLKKRAREKQQAEWRRDMRAKIQLVRNKRDERILKEAWVKWERSHTLIAADQYFDEQLVVRLYQLWKSRLRETHQKAAVADSVSCSRLTKVKESYWDHWRASTDLSRIEKIVSERVELRIKSEAFSTWDKKARNVRNADGFYDTNVLKKIIRSWKTARDRIRNLEVRADKHIDREDDVLLRAAMRVWRAHERGKILNKIMGLHLEKMAWAVWRIQLDHQRKLEDSALRFRARLNSSGAIDAFSSWRRVLTARRNAHSIAARFYHERALRRAVFQWRSQFRAKLKLAKKARIAENFLVLQKSWTRAKEKYQERVVERTLQAFEQSRIKRIFAAWLILSQKSRQQRLAEELILEQVRRRILSDYLTHWTNRVIENKVRELEVSQRNEAVLLISAFKKWKSVRARHVEELGLMESYQDIKRHENVRRIFIRWLTAARNARHRREFLQQKEEEIKLSTIEVAWDRWRECFRAERLRPLEQKLLLQKREALKYRSFAMWFSRTQSLPAIHFDSKRVKSKYWKAWMNTMPRALQARTAREVDKKAILRKYFEKWLQEHRTKLSLKAVARARYFPAPIAPVPTIKPALSSRPFILPLSYVPRNKTSRNNFPRRTSRSISPEEFGPSESLPIPNFAGLRDRLKAPIKARSEVSPTRTLISEIPPTRASSPARSTKSSVPAPWYLGDRSPARSPAPPSSVSGFEERSLWQELQEVRRKSQTPSEKSRLRRPP